MRFSLMKIVEGKCASKYCEVISAEKLPDLSDANKGYILKHHKWYGGPKPPPISHQGINDAFVEKASVVRYFYRGKWLELQGAD